MSDHDTKSAAGSEFDTDTAYTVLEADPTGAGRFAVEVSDRWSVGTGPNGGYLAGLLARIVDHAAPGRPLRSMTTHFLKPTAPGPAEVSVEVVRAGRSLSVLDVALTRGGEPLTVARCAVAGARPGPSFTDRTPPSFCSPDADPESIEREDWGEPTFVRRRYDTRYLVGGTPIEYTGVGEMSGWMRTADRRPVDQALAVAITDAWIPPILSRLDPPLGASTIDLSVHLFDTLDEPYDGWCAVTNRSTVLSDGYVDMDTEVWTADGRLLTQGRQLCATFPRMPLE